MTRREMLLSVGLVFGVSLVTRIVAASIVVFPKPEDTAYYVAVAGNMLDGRGLVSDALWSYQTPPLEIPRAAFEVWLPLPTFLSALPMALFGPTFQAAQVSSIVVGSVVPVLAWRLAADVADERGLAPGRARTLALGAGLTAAVYLPLLLHSALPDSTMPFAALALGACLLMTRIARDTGGLRRLDARLVGLGALLGLAAWTRNEAAWLALVWVGIVLSLHAPSPRTKAVMIGLPALVAFALFVPWAVRDWVVFGNPLPGQALANALSVRGSDVFAWWEEPTLARYLAVGPARLVQMRIDGLLHNLLNVLLAPGAPLSIVGLVALPWFARSVALRPVVLFAGLTFLVTSLVFPVATTWGTFLHAAGPVHVLLIVAALLGLDALIARVGIARGWTRPVAWLGATLTVAGAVLFSVALMPTFGRGSRDTADRYVALTAEMTAAGLPLESLGPVITDYPIWLSETSGVPGLALPDESPAAVLDLAAAFPGTTTLVIHGGQHTLWPDVLDAHGPGSECFDEVALGTPADPALAAALDGTRVFRLVCR
ncbi:MAG TPA: hypothetical protein VGQ58_01910 [Candidatus Limnocylindrales bacterium]|nr:hypothetical protein [Candidatus Limnocylindrales bacterium]